MNPTSAPAYLNGEFTTVGECRIAALDRGFLFGDSIYEVIQVYDGEMFEWPAHFERLTRSLRETGITAPHTAAEWAAILNALIERANGAALSLYLQVSRGVAPRNHYLETTVAPTVFAMAVPFSPPPPELLKKGVSVVTAEDMRWHRCDIKATSLMGNVLLKARAVAAGVYDVILLRGDRVTESSSANVFIARDGVLATPPTDQWILPGITRGVLIRLAKKAGVEVQERNVAAAELKTADEIWLTSSTREILPVTQLDGQAVGAGVPGPLWHDFMGYMRNPS